MKKGGAGDVLTVVAVPTVSQVHKETKLAYVLFC